MKKTLTLTCLTVALLTGFAKAASISDAKAHSKQKELENSITDFTKSVDIAPLYDDIQACDSAENFEGEWSSPDAEDKHFGELTITDQNSEGFHFEGTFYQHHGEYPFTDDGPNIGEASGYAHFINDSMAICKNASDEEAFDSDYSDPDGYAIFYLHNDSLYIRTTGTVGMMGGEVVMDGEYVSD